MRKEDVYARIPKCFDKKNDTLEICLPLFDTCNSNCEFCYEIHGRVRLTEDSFSNAYEDIKKYIVPIVAERDYKKIKIKIYGGELFFDAQPEWIYPAYTKLVNSVRKLFKNQKIETKFITNGMFTKWDRADKLVDDTNSYIGMSYDVVGRYRNEERFMLFKDTFYHFYNKGVLMELSCILAKPCIDRYIKGNTFLDEVPQNVHVDANFYIPTRSWEKYISNSDDYFNFFYWGIKNQKFNIDYIELLINAIIPEERKHIEKICSCRDTLTYIPEKRIFSKECIETRAFGKQYYHNFFDNVSEDNCFAYKTNMMLEKCGCMYCEHYLYCPMQCAASILFDGYKQTICPMKKIFSCIDEKDIKNYREWRKKYRDKNA